MSKLLKLISLIFFLILSKTSQSCSNQQNKINYFAELGRSNAIIIITEHQALIREVFDYLDGNPNEQLDSSLKDLGPLGSGESSFFEVEPNIRYDLLLEKMYSAKIPLATKSRVGVNEVLAYKKINENLRFQFYFVITLKGSMPLKFHSDNCNTAKNNGFCTENYDETWDFHYRWRTVE